MTSEAKRPACQVRSKPFEHSRPEDNPEMFTVFSKGTPVATSVQCLAHAVKSEQRGYRVEIILT